ncbi:MAG: RNA polymerase sigma factor [Planctomycetota bacterium]
MVDREPSFGPTEHPSLVREWYGRVYALCRSKLRCASDAEDAVQETFLRAIRGVHTLRTPDAMGGWLRSTASHVCVDVLRRKHCDVYEPREMMEVAEPTHDHETEDELVALIHQLPELLREPILLHYYEDMTYDQIAQWIGVARSTVNERLSKARHQLRRQLISQECHDEL